MPNLRSSGPRTAVAPLWQTGAAELIRWVLVERERSNNLLRLVVGQIFHHRQVWIPAQNT
jgi:hypothetical protein